MPKKWERDARAKHMAEHRERIRLMQPCVDDKEPKRHPKDNRKAIDRDRILAAVEKDNRLLLDRLGKAMENHNIDNYMKPVKFASVQAENRKNELRRITADNLRLLYRIQNTDPVYKAIEWERDAERREKYLAAMSEFPDMYVPKYTPSKQFQRAKTRFQEFVAASSPTTPSAGLASSFSPPKSPFIQPPEGEPMRNGLLRPLSRENLTY